MVQGVRKARIKPCFLCFPSIRAAVFSAVPAFMAIRPFSSSDRTKGALRPLRMNCSAANQLAAITASSSLTMSSTVLEPSLRPAYFA